MNLRLARVYWMSLCTVVSCLGTTVPLSTADATTQDQPIMRLKEIRSEDKGFGLTVFRGIEIEAFPVEVVSVMHSSSSPKRGVIWIRCEGGPHPGLQVTGPIMGMSGSPIYLWSKDELAKVEELRKGESLPPIGLLPPGRLIGAFAYGFSFSKGCYAGVQPIELMRDVCQRAANEQDSTQEYGQSKRSGTLLRKVLAMRKRNGSNNHAWRAEAIASLWLPAPWEEDPLLQNHGPEGLDGVVRPMKLPFAVPSVELARKLGTLLEPLGMMPVVAPPGSATSKAPAEIEPHLQKIRLEPGSVLAIPLVFGDVDFSAAGTVTDVLPDGRLLAFGHAFMGRGPLALPMATGYTHFVLPNYSTSFKMSGSAIIKGALVRDELAAVIGDPNGQYSTSPVQVDVRMPGASKQSYRYQVINHRSLTPILAVITALVSISAERQLPVENTVRMEAEMAFEGNRKLCLDTTIAGSSANSLIFELLPPIATMVDNPFEPMMLEQMQVKINVEPVLRSASFVSARLVKAEVAPGDDLNVMLELEPYGKPRITKRVGLTIPDDLRDGDYELFVTGASNYLKMLLSNQPHLQEVSNGDELHAFVQQMMEVDSLSIYTLLKLPQEGLALGRTELPKLPSSQRALIAAPTSTLARPFAELVVNKTQILLHDKGYVSNGQLMFRVRVRRDLQRN